MQLKVSDWDDLPGSVLAESSLRCCCRRKRRPEVQELKLADLLGALMESVEYEFKSMNVMWNDMESLEFPLDDLGDDGD